MKSLICGILLGLFLLGALLMFLCRRRDPIDKEAGVKIGQEDSE